MSGDNVKKPLQIVFLPGCFENFEGSQEDLDEMIAELTRLFESGEIENHIIEITEEELMEVMEDMENDEEYRPPTLH